MQAIVTKFLGATDPKPSRIKATSASGLTVTISYPHELSSDDAHRLAAQKLCDKHGWTNALLGGGLSNSEEVWVMIPRGFKLVESAT